MSVPRGVNILDMQARMAQSYVTKRANLGTATAVAVLVATQDDGMPLPGNLYYPGDRSLHTVTVQGTFDATVEIQGSRDNVNWQTLTPTTVPAGTDSSGSITAPGVFVYQGSYRSLRAQCTAYTSGSAAILIESARS